MEFSTIAVRSMQRGMALQATRDTLKKMMDNPAISIITPVFNGEKYIKECMDVIANQSCPVAEHVIVDGQSTDGTVDIVKMYASRYPHIRWISEEDKGQSDALNKGVALAKGEIIGILNVDDLYEPGVFNRVLEIFKTLPNPSLLVGNCKVWDNHGNLRYINRPKKMKITDLLVGFGVHPHPVNPSAYFYHKNLHNSIGPFIEGEVAQDLSFILSAVQAAHVAYVDETWGNWRKLEGTQTVREQEDGSSAIRYKRIVGECYDRLSARDKIRVGSKRLYYRMRARVRKSLA